MATATTPQAATAEAVHPNVVCMLNNMPEQRAPSVAAQRAGLSNLLNLNISISKSYLVLH